MTKTIQIAKINPKSFFSFNDKLDLGPQPAPLVTAKFFTKDSKSIIKIRIIVFIDVDYTGKDPYYTLVEEKKEEKLVINIKYDYKDKMVKGYTAWYIELDHRPTANITTTETFLIDTDPQTSRGTTTSVSH